MREPMKRSCKYCGKTHSEGTSCASRPKPKARIKPGTREVRFRNTAAWRRKRVQIRERDYHLCKACAADRRITYHNLEVHHIKPLAERFDLRLDDANLVTLCGACHEKAESGDIGRDTLVRLARQKTPPLLLAALKS